ncbi:MAG: DUF72 domain-containing protein [Thaumarchaeota archaeon]|nr:DUF72 domain-containing protein [Nitrososphaerota archaeon]
MEINSSFYAQPTTAMLKSWSEKTNDGFRFSFKALRMITHIQKLGKGSSELAVRFSKALDSLGPRRGPVLFQLPPYSKQDLSLLGGFLTETSSIKKRVFEFRHESWLKDETFETLEEHGAGFCIAETEDLEPVFRVTGGFAYFRLRKDSYDGRTIEKWAERILDAAKGAPEAYVYLRHDDTGENAVLAERLAEKLKAA